MSALADPIIYKAWPEAVVMAELRVFKDAMHNGAGPDELSAGLLAVDFLTRASELSDTAQMLVDAATDEAKMRITLMRSKEAESMDAQERRTELIRALTALDRGLSSVTRMIEAAKDRFETAEELREYMERWGIHGGHAAPAPEQP